jgi:hypothetical protein
MRRLKGRIDPPTRANRGAKSATDGGPRPHAKTFTSTDGIILDFVLSVYLGLLDETGWRGRGWIAARMVVAGPSMGDFKRGSAYISRRMLSPRQVRDDDILLLGPPENASAQGSLELVRETLQRSSGKLAVFFRIGGRMPLRMQQLLRPHRHARVPSPTQSIRFEKFLGKGAFLRSRSG